MATVLNTVLDIQGVAFRVVEEDVEGSQLTLTLIPADEIVHGCPAKGSGVTTCCGRSPWELSRTDRMTITGLVTCAG